MRERSEKEREKREGERNGEREREGTRGRLVLSLKGGDKIVFRGLNW